MKQWINIISLGTENLDRARIFYEKGLGWTPKEIKKGVMVYYCAGGVLLAICDNARLEHETGVVSGAGLGNSLLSHNTQSREEVDRIIRQAQKAGAIVLAPSRETSWGGYAGAFSDPDGHAWEVVWNPKWFPNDEGKLPVQK